MTRLRSVAAATLFATALVACKETPAGLGPTVAAAQAAGTAQDTLHRRGRPLRGMFRLPPQLELTAEQKAQIERIRTETMEKNRPLMEQVRSIVGAPEPPAQGERPRRGRRMRELTDEQRAQVRPLFEQIRANHRAAHEQVMEILTPEQKQTFEKLRAERAARRGERGHRGHRDGSGPRS